MKTRIVVVIFIVATLIFVCLLGAYSSNADSREKEINQGAIVIKQIDAIKFATYDDNQQKTLTYVGVVSESDASYAGCLQYTDDVYLYYYDSAKACLRGIMQCPGLREEGVEIPVEAARAMADQLYSMYAHDVNLVNVNVDISTALSGTYLFKLEEVVNNVGTGAMASICISDKGYLIGANFISKEDAAVITGTKPTGEPLSESEALAIAQTAIIDDIGGPDSYDSLESLKNEVYKANVRTFKGVTYWMIETRASYMQSGQKKTVFYGIKVDYFTGEILMVASSNH